MNTIWVLYLTAAIYSTNPHQAAVYDSKEECFTAAEKIKKIDTTIIAICEQQTIVQ